MSGCFKQQRHYRYVEVSAVPEAAVAAARASAIEHGICPVADTTKQLIALVAFGRPGLPETKRIDCDELPMDKGSSAVESAARKQGGSSYSVERIGVRAGDVGGRTRIGLSGKRRTLIDQILPEATSYHYVATGFRHHQTGILVEPGLRVGSTSASGRTFPEGEAGFLAGGRVWRSGGGELTRSAEHSLAVIFGVALVAELQRNTQAIIDDKPTTRFGVGLQYDRVATVNPLPGTGLRQGPRTVVRLTLDGLSGKRNGVEVGLGVQPIDWAGVYARVGYQTDEPGGMTYTVGAELGAGPSLYVYLTPVAVGLMYLLGRVLIEAQPDGEPDMTLP